MKKKDIQDLHTRTTEELIKTANEIKSELFDLSLELSMQKLKNTSLIKRKKDDLARIKTILRGKELQNG